MSAFSSSRAPNTDWWTIPTFDSRIGDIKSIWEASRFCWAVAMAERLAAGEEAEFARLNRWLLDWCYHNPPYKGPNWMCGQETSIRVLALAVVAMVLDQDHDSEPALLNFIDVHLRRIASTTGYAVAQDNNHGITEAAALFVGGSLLCHGGLPEGNKMQSRGRSLLENRVERLIDEDGTFSQYSVNYHRMVLDTLSIVECWRRRKNLGTFSAKFYSRAEAAARWLFTLTDPETGHAPNLGANDGAHLLQLGDIEYRDLRPSIQVSMSLFGRESAYVGEGSFNLPLARLSVERPERRAVRPDIAHFRAGGLAAIRSWGWFVLLRYPKFRFRPSQADLLHLDVWYEGVNLLRDGGTYSYASNGRIAEQLRSCSGHNTIQFDSGDQMPRLGRFLYSHWPKPLDVLPPQRSDETIVVGAGYRDWLGRTHYRRVSVMEHSIRVEDRVAGFASSAVLRWRLFPEEWTIEGFGVSCRRAHLAVRCNIPIARFELAKGFESLYYLRADSVPVLEVEVHGPATLITDITKSQ